MSDSSGDEPQSSEAVDGDWWAESAQAIAAVPELLNLINGIRAADQTTRAIHSGILDGEPPSEAAARKWIEADSGNEQPERSLDISQFEASEEDDPGSDWKLGKEKLRAYAEIQRQNIAQITYKRDDGSKIGSGLWGKVFKGVNKKTGKHVAIKEIKLTPGISIGLFLREPILHSSLEHEFIIKLIGFEVVNVKGRKTSKILRMVTELMPDGSLEEIGKDKLDQMIPMKCVRQMVKALLYLYQNGLRHADIHPGNLLIDLDTPGGQMKLADFGCARHHDDKGFQLDMYNLAETLQNFFAYNPHRDPYFNEFIEHCLEKPPLPGAKLLDAMLKSG